LFWRAVGIGALTGIVAGLIGGFIGGLGLFGLGLKGAVLSGMAGGFFASLASESLMQHLTSGGISDPLGVLVSGVSGLITGGVFGAVGYGVGKVIRSFLANKWQAVQNQGFKYDPSLQPYIKGKTTWLGDIFINPRYPASDQARTLIHEQVHSFFTPRGIGQRIRASIRIDLYNNSFLVKYVEEAIAESVAQIATGGSLRQGLQFPISHGYVTPVRTIIEGIITTAGISGLLYGIYEALR
jgi:hypothetical protein